MAGRLLHYAARSGHKAVLQWLFNKGAGIRAMDNDGQMPLHWAAENGREAVVRGGWLAGRSRLIRRI